MESSTTSVQLAIIFLGARPSLWRESKHRPRLDAPLSVHGGASSGAGLFPGGFPATLLSRPTPLGYALVGVSGCVIWRKEIPIGNVYTSEEFRRDVQVYFNFPAVSFEMAQGTYPSFAETTEASSLGILRAICERDQEFSNEPASGGG